MSTRVTSISFKSFVETGKKEEKYDKIGKIGYETLSIHTTSPSPLTVSLKLGRNQVIQFYSIKIHDQRLQVLMKVVGLLNRGKFGL